MQNTFTLGVVRVCVLPFMCVNQSSSLLSATPLSSLCKSSPRPFRPLWPNCFLLLFFFFSPLQRRSLLNSCLLPPLLFFPSLDSGFLQGKNSIVHFVSLSASIYAPPVPSFLFILFLSFLFHLFSPSRQKVSGPIYWNFPFALLASQWLITAGVLSSLLRRSTGGVAQGRKEKNSNTSTIHRLERSEFKSINTDRFKTYLNDH